MLERSCLKAFFVFVAESFVPVECFEGVFVFSVVFMKPAFGEFNFVPEFFLRHNSMVLASVTAERSTFTGMGMLLVV